MTFPHISILENFMLINRSDTVEHIAIEAPSGVCSFFLFCFVFVQCIISLFFTLATFLDMQALLKVTSLQVQIKTSLALVALIRLRYKYPETPRTIEVSPNHINLNLYFLPP